MAMVNFPSGFKWGTATAAHQVEGHNFNNDWWDWEQIPGHVKNSENSSLACDWWGGRYLEDFDKSRALGTNAHRLSVEWSRLEPSEGEWDADALEFYRKMLTALLERGMTPFVTLHHFTNPRWLAEDGGWENPRVVQRFARFARRVVTELKDLCNNWITLNEPNVLAYQGYASGNAPPGVKDVRRALKVMENQVRAHAGAYYAIKDEQPTAQVGVAHHFRFFYPHRTISPLDRLTAHLRDRSFNWQIFRALADGRLASMVGGSRYLPEVKGTQDFIGVNYYYTDRVIFDPSNPGDLFGRTVLAPRAQKLKTVFDSIGNLEQCGLETFLLKLASHRKPIYITENGIFDDGSSLQSEYLVTHLSAVQRAIAAGADVRGYFWWTLTDNFEWSEGYGARFGLHALDLDTQVRTAKPVAAVFARVIRENGIPGDLTERYGRPG